MKFIPSIILCAAVSVSGCATVTRGTNDVLNVNTTPSGAQVQTSNGFSCASTPCAIKMPRRSEFVVSIAKAGCRPVNVNVTHKTANGGGAALAGNVLVGGVIGLGVDAATGASQELMPNPVQVTLEC
ncbi:translation initiation factor 2 [Yoonia maritima]|uniref:translation initiation factor 2 n=1 Tax=Yoonia maritima TaxID=1435347 RepID=UPI000D1143E7|nr:translation initiation factor 2 [Yoonia maritima]